VLLVVCADPAIAAWCATPISLGHPGLVLAPVVAGPNRVPVVTEPRQATESPELTVLSAIAHGGHRPKVLDALLAALRTVDHEHANLYADVVLAALPAAARHHLEALMTIAYEYQSDFARRYVAEGKAEGEATAVLTVLAARGIQVPDTARERITSCADVDQLETWIRRAATAEKIDELFD
jgi:hypothetical protein